MAVIQLLVTLLVIGFLLWAVNYLFKDYVEPWVLALVNKIAVVAVVLFVLFWVLSLFGLAPAPPRLW